MVHGGPGVPIPPAKLRALRRSASVPVSSYTQHQHHEDLASVIDELDAEVEKRKKNGKKKKGGKRKGGKKTKEGKKRYG